jgi:hypothetical protein
MSKHEICLFSTFEKHIHNDWRCLRFGDDRMCKCDTCLHFIADDELDTNVRRIKCKEVK